MNPGFADLGSQIEYVKQSLGMGDPTKGTFKEGNGWDGRYELYCVKCNVEISKPFIDEKDPKRVKRCPKCKESNELWSREERRKQLQTHIDQLEQEEITMKARKKKFKKWRKKFPLKKQFDDLELGDLDDEKGGGLCYKEHEMWQAKVDLDEYLDNEYYIPRSQKEVTDRAWNLHAKYQSCKKQMDIAVQEKQKGNDALKDGQYEKAIKHYTKSIRARTDYKQSYNNRMFPNLFLLVLFSSVCYVCYVMMMMLFLFLGALAYMKLKQYDKCIANCTYVIEMIKAVDIDQDQTDVNFKAYLRRANALKCKEQYEEARKDLEMAQSIKPNDGSVKKLLRETKLLHKRVKLRAKLVKQCNNDVNLNDFESVFKLSVEFLTEATSNEEEWHFETGHSEELLRRLLIFLAKEKKYCVRFADNNGVELSLKYLRKKFKIIKKWKEKLPSLEKPFMLLNYCCEKDVNFNALKDKKLQKLIGIIVLYTYGYFGEMPKELQSISMRFVAVVCSIDHIREFIPDKHGSKLLAYFLKFQKKTDPTKQEPKAIRCLFESLSYLCSTKTFQNLLVKQKSPYLYEVFLHSMMKYNESKIIKRRKDMNEDDRKALTDYEQMQFAISVLLDGLGLLFDGGRGGDGNNNNKGGQNQQNDAEEKEKENLKNEIIDHFLANKNIDKYMGLLTDYLHSICKSFREYNNDEKESEDNKKDTQRYFGQLGKCLNVFVALSRSNQTHPILFKYSIHRDLQSLIGVCRDPTKHRYPKMKPMLKICRNNILIYFDQISNDKKFDVLFSNDFDNDASNEKATKLPYFWSFICDVFIEEYKERPHPQLMSQFAHFKSCVIRLIYRWACRRVDATKPFAQQNKASVPTKEEMEKYKDTYIGKKKISYIMELIITKYFSEFLEWLSYNDLQVLANTPLVIRQLIIYSCNMSKERPKIKKQIKKILTLKRLQIIMRLMKAPHDVIQYNSCLLMATINEFDKELAATCEAMGAVAILEGFNRVQQQRQKQMQQMQQQNPAIGYK